MRRTEGSIVHGGRERGWLAHVPERTAPPGGWPAVLALHGARSGPEVLAALSRLHEAGDRAGFAVVYPRGTGEPGTRALAWDAGYTENWPSRNRIDDLGFLEALLDELPRRYPLDPTRIFACGMSNGAAFLYRALERVGTRLGAIATVGGPPVDAHRIPAVPISVLHLHGSADEYVPLAGGRGPRSPPDACFPPIRAQLLRYVRAWGLPDRPESDRIPADPARRGHMPATLERWAAEGRREPEVLLYVVEGGGHGWPGGPDLLDETLGPTPRNIDANELIWRFFQRHPAAGPSLRSRLEAPYRATRYEVMGPGGKRILRVDEPAGLDEALGGAEGFALITAANPGSRLLSPGANALRQAELAGELAARGLAWWPSVAIDPAGAWPPEEGALVPGLAEAEALALARRFGQAAILHGSPGGPVRLVWVG